MSTLAPAVAPVLLAAAALAAAGKTAAAPLAPHFEPNRGQAGGASYLARGADLHLAVTADGALLAARGGACADVVQLRVTGAAGVCEGSDPVPGASHYLRGRDPACWTTGVPRFARVVCRDLLAGVGLVWHTAAAGEIEHDFLLAPGTDPRTLRLRFEGARALRVGEEGDLVVETPSGAEIRDRRPVAWQEDARGMRMVPAGWVLRGDGEAGFLLGPYDPGRPLVIDPVLSYSSYLGGANDDEPQRVAVGASGDLYVAGYTDSPDFPVAGPLAPYRDLTDAFITRLDAATGAPVWSTFLGGSGDDAVFGLAVDGDGSVVVAGETDSTDFPLVSAAQPVYGGAIDAFVAEVDPSGSTLRYASYLGGAASDTAYGVALDGAGGALVAGRTESADFQVLSAFLPVFGGGFYDAFLGRLDRAARAMTWVTYLGGADDDEAFDVAADAAGRAHLTGDTFSTDFPLQMPLQASRTGFGADAFVSRFTVSGAALELSTYLGGSDDDWGSGIGVDGLGNILVGGTTASDDFPIAGPQHGPPTGSRGFVSRLLGGGTGLLYSTVFGGSAGETGIGFAADATGGAVLAGLTSSRDLPSLFGVQPFPGGDVSDGFAARLAPDGSLSCSTYFGGGGQDSLIAVATLDPTRFVVAGWTDSGDLRTVSPFQPLYAGGVADGMVARIGCFAAPGGIGNALAVTKDPTATGAVFTWPDDDRAASYRLYGESDKGAPFTTVVALAVGGAAGVVVPIAPGPLVFYRVSGGNCCGEGTR